MGRGERGSGQLGVRGGLAGMERAKRRLTAVGVNLTVGRHEQPNPKLPDHCQDGEDDQEVEPGHEHHLARHV